MNANTQPVRYPVQSSAYRVGVKVNQITLPSGNKVATSLVSSDEVMILFNKRADGDPSVEVNAEGGRVVTSMGLGIEVARALYQLLGDIFGRP